jgi:hypothetical protein
MIFGNSTFSLRDIPLEKYKILRIIWKELGILFESCIYDFFNRDKIFGCKEL